MYGSHVHQAVKAAGDTETGITIHLVNEHYDEGKINFPSGNVSFHSGYTRDDRCQSPRIRASVFPRG